MSVGIRAYVTNFENMIELTVISLAAVCLSTQEFEEVEKWFSAFGIVLAYLGSLKHLLLGYVYQFKYPNWNKKDMHVFIFPQNWFSFLEDTRP